MNTLHVVTPTFKSKRLQLLTQKNIFLKMDCFQPVGSFKIRGIGHLCQDLVKKGCQHLVASSGGNAGYAVAYAANKLNVPATIFVPKTTNHIFLARLKEEGATVNIAGDVWDEAHFAAMRFVQEINAGYVPPFDHPLIWEGHMSIVDEIHAQCPKPDAIVVAVGGGGLACGILQGLEKHHWPDIPLFAVETQGSASFAATKKAGELISLDKINTIATSLGAKTVTKELVRWMNKQEVNSLVVSDKDAILACKQFVDDHRALVEPSCGAALSVVYQIEKFPELTEKNNILVIVCGGIGISLELMEQHIKALV